jgi:hypothetical protein
MEINEIRSHLERSSKRASLLTMIGVAFGIAALVFSFYYLNKQYEKLQHLNTAIDEKTEREKELDQRLKEKQDKLSETQTTFADYQNVVKEISPEVANDAIKGTIDKNPQAGQVILDVVTQNAPQSVPPPRGSRIAFSTTNNVLVREKPDLSAKAIDKLTKGQTIYVTNFSENSTEWKDLSGRWARIQTETGTQGWVFEPFVAFSQKRAPVRENPLPQVQQAVPPVRQVMKKP